MDHETPSLKILEVLRQIKTQLDEFDQRLRNVEVTVKPSTVTSTGSTEAAVTKITTKEFRSFRTKIELRSSGEEYLQEIYIFGRDLLALLRGISGLCLDAGKDTGGDDQSLSFASPFADLMCHFEMLSLVCDEGFREEREFQDLFTGVTWTIDLTNDISQLFRCLETAGDCRAYVTKRRNYVSKGAVLFEHLPGLFGPGTLLINSEDAEDGQVVEVSSCECVSTYLSTSHCVVEYWHFKWNGEAFVRVGGSFQVDRFPGTKPISGLPFRPLVVSEPQNSISNLRAAILKSRHILCFFERVCEIERGEFPTWHYAGASSTARGFGTHENSGRVVVDPEGFSMQNANGPKPLESFGCYCKACTEPKKLGDILTNARGLLLLPTSVEGYNFSEGQWALFPISKLSKCSWQSDLLETVDVEESIRKMLMADLTTYFNNWRKWLNSSLQDVIWNFRDALVYHFHGPPGVGKTLLAEVMAEFVKRPLLTLGPAGLGLDPVIFDSNLSSLAEHCFRWGAILFIFNDARFLILPCSVDADAMLQARRPGDGLAQNALVTALVNRLGRFRGVLIFSSHTPSVDYALRPYMKQIPFAPLSADQTVKLFTHFLDQLEPSLIQSRALIDYWLQNATGDLNLSGLEIRKLIRDATGRARMMGRGLELDDIIKTWTGKTGRLEEWDMVRDRWRGHSYEEGDDADPRIVDTLLREFGNACSIPDDGRLSLSLTKSFYSALPLDSALHSIGLLQEANKAIRAERWTGTFTVVDWGWPSNSRWQPQEGCVYRPRGPSTTHASTGSQEQWRRAGFALGLRRLLDNDDCGTECGKPWRRLFIKAHLSADPWKFQSPVMPDSAIRHDAGFHIAFYEMIYSDPAKSDESHISRHTVPFYNQNGSWLRKSCFTMCHIPMETTSTSQDAIHWSILCLTPKNFWPSTTYITSRSPSLRAQSAYYVARALGQVASRWRTILQELDELVNVSDVLRQQAHLQDILFDDDAFSTSKRYFWIITFIHEAVSLLDDNIQQWSLYQKRAVVPFMAPLMKDQVEHWREYVQQVLTTADKDASEACEELRQLRQAFCEKLARITVMRDGVSCLVSRKFTTLFSWLQVPCANALSQLFNASAVMESRASTQLGENVKLLTFVSIFFLPLGLCVAIWSINESYNRDTLLIVATIVATITYFVTFNLNNIVRVMGNIYAPRRRSLVAEMEQDAKWSSLGRRFQAFQRSEAGQKKPSEWLIPVFFLVRMLRGVKAVVSGLFKLI
ncbi:Lon protease [Madurella mycetomatis]|uniref:Lon protease n=1 Tax=Madurella mycetomatis TaxID=100816 RepID=A0A175WDD0_9PEZI|nr:Lon protease [Madurella mycetomatis]